MKVCFYTLGCRVNQYETDAARELFIRRGYEACEDPSDADIVVVNTCTVTSEADRKSRQHLRRMARINPRAVVVAMGCMAEMANGSIDADVVCGTRDKNLVVDKTEAFLAERRTLEHKSEHQRPEVSRTDVYHEFGTVLSPEGTRAFMKLEDGCNKFCSYCIIPYARGRVVSREEDNILEEARYLARKGFREVVLSGIHICSYGQDRGEDVMSLLKVIRKIAGIDGIERIRLGSVEPMSLTAEFIEGLAGIDKLCPHFHLSLQSGSDTVLKRMNRDYNTSEFLEKAALLRSHFPGMSLTTDIICGFPGETDEEFAQTCEFAVKAGFSKIHVFPYSLREGTVAAKMEQLPSGVGKKRASALIEISARAEEEYAAGKVGSESTVLLESFSDGYAYGYIPEYVRACVKMTEDEFNFNKGNLVNVSVVSSHDNVLECILSQNS